MIRVKQLNAISIEANEIRCPRIERTPRSYPVPKDAGWRRIEGNEVALKTLWAHHVLARMIVAEKIVATEIHNVKKRYVWPGEGAHPVRNRIVKVDPSTGRATGE